jgi:hypothetical protein
MHHFPWFALVVVCPLAGCTFASRFFPVCTAIAVRSCSDGGGGGDRVAGNVHGPVVVAAACRFACGGNDTTPDAPTWFCPVGSASRQQVPPGHYSTPTSAAVHQRTGFAMCEPGSFCVGGIAVRGRTCLVGTPAQCRIEWEVGCKGGGEREGQRAHLGVYGPTLTLAPLLLACSTRALQEHSVPTPC